MQLGSLQSRIYLRFSEPGDAMSDYFINKSRNVIASVDINYQVDRSDNSVTVTHSYFDENGLSVDTIIGLHRCIGNFLIIIKLLTIRLEAQEVFLSLLKEVPLIIQCPLLEYCHHFRQLKTPLISNA